MVDVAWSSNGWVEQGQQELGVERRREQGRRSRMRLRMRLGMQRRRWSGSVVITERRWDLQRDFMLGSVVWVKEAAGTGAGKDIGWSTVR